MANDLITRVPPHSKEAEEAVLACMLVSREAIAVGIEKLTPKSFYYEVHGELFAGMLDIHARRKPVDLITLRDHLEGLGRLDAIGGYGALVDLAGSVPTVAHMPHYADMVAEKAKRRQFIHLAQSMAAAAYDDANEDPIGDGLKAMVALDIKDGGRGEWVKLADIEQANFERMMDAADLRAQGKVLEGLLETGLPSLDNILVAGPGDMVVVAAKTGFGKTVLASNIAEHVANIVKDTGLVAMFTLEMSKEAMGRRFTASATGISSGRQLRGELEENEWPLVSAMLEKRGELPLYIRDKSNVTPSEMLAACRRLEATERRPMKLVVVDYLTLADADGKTENETTRASKVSRGLKVMSGELGCPVIAVAQLNRGVDGRESKRPELRDLKQSGSIEQDASAVIFIHREGHKEGQKVEAGEVEVIVAKNRHGHQGTASLWFDAPRVRFQDTTGFAEPQGEWRPTYEDHPDDHGGPAHASFF